MNNLLKLPAWVLFLFLAVVAVLTNIVVIPVGLALHNSEYANFLLAADGFLTGPWTAFPFHNVHGGMTLTVLRSLWLALWYQFDQGDAAHMQAHMMFSYAVSPVLMTCAAYTLARAYCTRGGALAVGLLSAVGFNFWAHIYGNDFYPAYFSLGFFLLALRGRGVKNPFLELSPWALFLAGVLSGHGIFLSRAMQLLVLVFFLPWGFLKSEFMNIERLRHTHTSVLIRVVVSVGYFLIFFGMYLEVFGRDLGTVSGHVIKIDGAPNFKIAVILWAIARATTMKYKISPVLVKRALIVGAGFLIGFSPELIHGINHGHLLNPKIYASFDFPMMMRIFGAVPKAFQSLVTGVQPYRGFEYIDTGLGQGVCIAAAVSGLVLLGKKAMRREDLQPFFLLTMLSVFAYIRVDIQTTEIAPPRYLAPLQPAILVGLGLLWDECVKRKKQLLVTLVFAVMISHHFGARLRLKEELQRTGYVKNLQSVVQKFQQSNIDFVISDDLWASSNLTLYSNGHPRVFPVWGHWGPSEWVQEAKVVKTAGILLQKEPTDPARLGDFSGRNWQLKPLGRVGPYFLYSGTAQ